LTLADLLRLEAHGAGSGGAARKSAIMVYLPGGPSHIDMYDMKPDAPAEIRGEFHPISTNVPGLDICEHMPLQAGMMDRLALLRGIRSVENDHFLSEVYSGLPRTAGKRPAFGSVVSRLAPGNSSLPPYVSLKRPTTDQFEFEKPYYAGPQHAPFRPFGESLDDLRPVKSMDLLSDRRSLLKSFDTLRRDLDRPGIGASLDQFHQKAIDIVMSPKVRDALRAARERPSAPIIALTPIAATGRRLAIAWGLHCVVTEDAHDFEDMVDRACRIAFREGFATAGQRIVVTAGVPLGTPGATNLLRVAFVGRAAGVLN
jgi:hypothetical protein